MVWFSYVWRFNPSYFYKPLWKCRSVLAKVARNHAKFGLTLAPVAWALRNHSREKSPRKKTVPNFVVQHLLTSMWPTKIRLSCVFKIYILHPTVVHRWLARTTLTAGEGRREKRIGTISKRLLRKNHPLDTSPWWVTAPAWVWSNAYPNPSCETKTWTSETKLAILVSDSSWGSSLAGGAFGKQDEMSRY